MGRSPFTVRDGRAPRVIQVIRHEIIRGDGRETVMRFAKMSDHND